MALIGVATAIWIAYCDPFGITDALDSTTEALVQRVAAPFYRGTGQDMIAIVQTNRHEIDDAAYGLTYPLSYSVQADLVNLLVAANVRLIFIDGVFVHHQSSSGTSPLFENQGSKPTDAGLRNLQDALQTAHLKHIPVFVAEVAPGPDLDGLRPLVRQTVTEWRIDHPGDYPLREEGRRTAAADIYLSLCGSAAPLAGCDPSLAGRLAHGHVPPMAVRFGTRYPRYEDAFAGAEEGRRCRAASTLAMARAALRGHRAAAPCINFLTLTVGSALSPGAFSYIAPMLRGRVVILGGGSQMGDDHEIPGLGVVPGATLHAAALDNLLTFGSRYRRWPADLPHLGRIGIDDVLKLLATLAIPISLRLFVTSSGAHARRPGRDCRRVAFEALAVAAAVTTLLAGGALLGSWFWYWPTSLALSIALLSGVVFSILDGDHIVDALVALHLTGFMAASVAGLLWVAGVGILLGWWPLGAAAAAAVAVAILFAARADGVTLARRSHKNGAKGEMIL